MHPGQAEDRPTWQPMGEIQFEETSCPICHSDNAILRYTKNIRGYPMKYYICSRCRALYANPRAGFDSLKKIYASADFFEGENPEANTSIISTLSGAKNIYAKPPETAFRVSSATANPEKCLKAPAPPASSWQKPRRRDLKLPEWRYPLRWLNMLRNVGALM